MSENLFNGIDKTISQKAGRTQFQGQTYQKSKMPLLPCKRLLTLLNLLREGKAVNDFAPKGSDVSAELKEAEEFLRNRKGLQALATVLRRRSS